MDMYRQKPVTRKTVPAATSQPKTNEAGCLWGLLMVLGSYFVLMAITRVTSGAGSKLDHLICNGTLICVVIVMLLGALSAYQVSRAEEAEKQRWAQSCKTSELAIVARREAEYWWDDYDGRQHGSPCSLQLEMNADQKAVCSNQSVVVAEVSQRTYDRLKECKTVRVYYLPESPLVFLLQQEL